MKSPLAGETDQIFPRQWDSPTPNPELKVGVFEHRDIKRQSFGLERLGLNTSLAPREPRFRRGTWLSAARGDRSHENSREIALSTRSVRKQSQRTIAFHYIDRALVTGTRQCPREDEERAYYRDSSSSRRLSADLERVLRSPPSFPFPPPINNFIRRSPKARKRGRHKLPARPPLADLEVEKPVSRLRGSPELSERERTGKPPRYPWYFDAVGSDARNNRCVYR